MTLLKGVLMFAIVIFLVVLMDEIRKVGDAYVKVAEETVATEKALVKETQATSKKLLATADKLRSDTTKQLSALQTSVDAVVADEHEVQERLLSREPMVYSRFLAVSGEAMKVEDAIRLSANSVADAMPKLTDSAVKSTENVEAIVATAREYVAPKEPPKKHWYTRWLPTIVVTAGKILF